MNPKLNSIALVLMIVGAINWGLVGLFNFDLVQALFGTWSPILARVTYLLVGLAGVYGLLTLRSLAIPATRKPAFMAR